MLVGAETSRSHIEDRVRAIISRCGGNRKKKNCLAYDKSHRRRHMTSPIYHLRLRQTKGRERTRCFFSPYTVLSLLLFIFISAFDSFFPFLFAVVFNSLLPMNGVLLSVGIFGAIKEGNKSRWFLQPPPVAKAEKHLPTF